jgi:hypothetical protein
LRKQFRNGIGTLKKGDGAVQELLRAFHEAGRRALSGFWAAVGTVAVGANEGTIIKRHRFVTDGAVGRLNARKAAEHVQIQLIIVFFSHTVA